MRQPNFDNMLKVLRHEEPERPTLFEFFLNGPLYQKLAGPEIVAQTDELAYLRQLVHAFKNAGYDYATVYGSEFRFPAGELHREKTISLNDGNVITDRASFEAYKWLEPDDFDYSHLDKLAAELPDGMKLIVPGPGGVLENVISLVGYENMCFMILDDPELAQQVFDNVGSRLVRYYELAAPHDTVGAVISNDDWGFKTQTMLGPEEMRQYIFPWHKKIVETIHAAGKPAILHSCGYFGEVMDEVIDDMKYDGKHSYEDGILPVEDSYDKWGSRIAILGGIDLDFICRSTPEEVYQRSAAMLARSAGKGGFALGTGNSVPEYIPTANYFAMISAATGERYLEYV
ncbi:MAG: uroporphyrinogen decarboxylase family protein [Armatimonadota bacterium]